MNQQKKNAIRYSPITLTELNLQVSAMRLKSVGINLLPENTLTTTGTAYASRIKVDSTKKTRINLYVTGIGRPVLKLYNAIGVEIVSGITFNMQYSSGRWIMPTDTTNDYTGRTIDENQDVCYIEFGVTLRSGNIVTASEMLVTQVEPYITNPSYVPYVQSTQYIAAKDTRRKHR